MEKALQIDILPEHIMTDLAGGQRLADFITTACAVYGVSSVISLAATGIGLPGAATAGAFCAGWTLGQLIF